MKIISYLLALSVMLIWVSCSQNKAEGVQEATLHDACSLNDPAMSDASKAILRDLGNLDNEILLNILDSLYAKDRSSRPFYFKAVTDSYQYADGYFSEALGYAGKEYVRKNTAEFLTYFENEACFTEEDLDIWASIVMLEFSLLYDNEPDRAIMATYLKELEANTRSCTDHQKETFGAFAEILVNQWDNLTMDEE